MPRKSYRGHVIVPACAEIVEKIKFDIPTGKLVLMDVANNIYKTMKDAKVDDLYARGKEAKPHPKGKTLTVKQLMDIEYPDFSETVRGPIVFDFLKNNMNGSNEMKFKDGLDDPAFKTTCKAPDAKKASEFINCLDKALPSLPSSILPPTHRPGVGFELRDSKFVCDTDFYNPGFIHAEAAKNKSRRGSSCRGAWGARRKRRGSARRACGSRRGSSRS